MHDRTAFVKFEVSFVRPYSVLTLRTQIRNRAGARFFRARETSVQVMDQEVTDTSLVQCIDISHIYVQVLGGLDVSRGRASQSRADMPGSTKLPPSLLTYLGGLHGLQIDQDSSAVKPVRPLQYLDRRRWGEWSASRILSTFFPSTSSCWLSRRAGLS